MPPANNASVRASPRRAPPRLSGLLAPLTATSRHQDAPAAAPSPRRSSRPSDARAGSAAARTPYDDVSRASRLLSGSLLLHRSPRTYDQPPARAARLRRSAPSAAAAAAAATRGQTVLLPQVRPAQRQSVYDWAPTGSNSDDDGAAAAPLRALPQPLAFGEDSPMRFGDAPTRFPEGGGESTFRMAVMRSQRNSVPRAGGSSLWDYPPMWGEQRAREDAASSSASSSASTSSSTQSRLNPIMSSAATSSSSTASSSSRYLRHRNGYVRSMAVAAASCLPEASVDLKRVINFLAKVRACADPADGIRLAIKSRFYGRDDWADILDDPERCDDLVLDTAFLRSAETSWLKAGGEFWGTQVAPMVQSMGSSARSSVSHSQDGDHVENSNQWSVKVSISSIDYDQLRLSESAYSLAALVAFV